MKVGDLVRRKGESWLAIILGVKFTHSISRENYREPIKYLDIMWCDEGDSFGDCEQAASSAFELVSEI